MCVHLCVGDALGATKVAGNWKSAPLRRMLKITLQTQHRARSRFKTQIQTQKLHSITAANHIPLPWLLWPNGNFWGRGPSTLSGAGGNYIELGIENARSKALCKAISEAFTPVHSWNIIAGWARPFPECVGAHCATPPE